MTVADRGRPAFGRRRAVTGAGNRAFAPGDHEEKPAGGEAAHGGGERGQVRDQVHGQGPAGAVAGGQARLAAAQRLRGPRAGRIDDERRPDLERLASDPVACPDARNGAIAAQNRQYFRIIDGCGFTSPSESTRAIANRSGLCS